MQATDVTLDWRPMSAADAPAWADLLAAAEAVDATGEHYDVDDLLEELADPALDAERDTIAGYAGGRMVAYGLVRDAGRAGGLHLLQAEGCVHPEHRRAGIGREVLRRTDEVAAALHRRSGSGLPAQVRVYSHDRNAGAGALLTGSGMRPVRYWYDMWRDLTEPPPPATVPAGLRLVGFHPALDESLRLARNEAFADHWGSVDRDEQSWRQWFTGSRAFRPALSFALLDGHVPVAASDAGGHDSATARSRTASGAGGHDGSVASAVDGAEIAGFLLSYEYEADSAASGLRRAYIGQIGTRRRFRGRGVASALIRTALHACRDAGYQRAELTVDTDNPSGALGLYQRCGFVINERWTTYGRRLGPRP